MRFWIAAKCRICTGIKGNAFERPPDQEGQHSTTFLQFKSERAEKRIIEYADSVTPLPKWQRNVESYRWNLFSQWYDGSENSCYGMQSWTISWLYGSSKLEVELQNCGLYANSRSSCHHAVDKEIEVAKSIDELVASRSVTGQTKCLDFDMFDAMIASALRKAHQHAFNLPKKSECRRATSSK